MSFLSLGRFVNHRLNIQVQLGIRKKLWKCCLGVIPGFEYPPEHLGNQLKGTRNIWKVSGTSGNAIWKAIVFSM